MAMSIGGMALGANTVGGSVVLTELENRGTGYKFNPPEIIRRNGFGLAVTSGGASITWKHDWLPKAEFLWWRTTLLSGAASKSFSSAVFYDETQTLTSYSYCVVDRPEYEYISYGVYYNVVINITSIR